MQIRVFFVGPTQNNRKIRRIQTIYLVNFSLFFMQNMKMEVNEIKSTIDENPRNQYYRQYLVTFVGN